MAAQMHPDAMLYLGGAETVLGVTARFAPLAGERGVYGLSGSPAEHRAAARVSSG
jgi:chemotaxis protein methyltransferase CheR